MLHQITKVLRKWTFPCLLFAVALPLESHAARFANQFTEFELPPQWQCNLEGAEWVCQSVEDTKKRDAIIVLAAKLKGDQDSLDQYLEYLKAAKTYTSIQGRPVKSEPKYAKTVNLNNQAWVDALHLESEIPGFYTRYLATVKEDIGVLVTYSINKAKYQNYLDDFENMIKTLKVFRKPGGINTGTAGNIFETANIPTHISENTVFPGAAPRGGSEDVVVKKKDDDSTFYILVGAIALIGFLIWRKRRQG
ncbi:MAG: hypothetical protein A2X94_05450 [Bdellovibrionales bacterium GWB1_55_8]|nr:MAG: hypothetical protein A2X94_05450 [Bdellovibrionales bacterium GWB1_55_8]